MITETPHYVKCLSETDFIYATRMVMCVKH